MLHPVLGAARFLQKAFAESIPYGQTVQRKQRPLQPDFMIIWKHVVFPSFYTRTSPCIRPLIAGLPSLKSESRSWLSSRIKMVFIYSFPPALRNGHENNSTLDRLFPN